MEGLVVKIGEMLDQKLEEKLVVKIEEMLDEKLEEELVVKIEKMLDEKLERKLDEKLDQKLDQKLDEKLGILEHKLEQKIEDVRQEIADVQVKLEEKITKVTEDMEKLRKEMLDQFFLFEQEYGDKIVSMGDYILVDKDKNEIRSKQVNQLENRVERLEVKSLVYENDIFKLQHQMWRKIHKRKSRHEFQK